MSNARFIVFNKETGTLMRVRNRLGTDLTAAEPITAEETAGLRAALAVENAGLAGAGSPADVVAADPGQLYWDQLARQLWAKQSGANDATNWLGPVVPGFNARFFGALGDGSDATAALQAAATAAAGNKLVIPPGNYLVTSTITIPANTIVEAYGARIFNTSTHFTLVALDSGCRVFGLEVEGAGNGSYDADGRAIAITGTLADYKQNVHLQDCYFHDLGAYAVHSSFASDVFLERCRMINVGYTGVMVFSGIRWLVSRCHIKGLGPGTSSNAYGVAFTRSSVADLVAFPRSKDCTVQFCTIEDNLIWEALDTHGGENCAFIGNTIRNCKIGIACVSSVSVASPLRCRVIGNTITGIGGGYGIAMTGTAAELAQGNVILGNTLKDCGQAANDLSGAIYCASTRAAVVDGNTIEAPRPNGIIWYFDNYGFSCNGNSIQDPWDNAAALPACIICRSNNNQGTISGNTLERVNTALGTNVALRGIYVVGSTTGNILSIGPNRNTCVVAMSNTTGANFTFGTLGQTTGLNIYSGFNSPEGVITAPIGSIYLNLNGGAGTTLFVKQTGSGSTGWVGK